MKKYIIIIFVCFVSYLNAQKITVSGYVLNNKSKESLPGVVIINKKTNETSISNDYGYYTIYIDANVETELDINYIGYNTKNIKITSDKNIIKNIELSEGLELEAVYVTSKHIKEISTYELSAKQIKLIPSLVGEKDVLKALQFIPGVQFGSEGTSNLIVRGGSPDQNMILLDDVPLYYVNHLGSFVSIFDVNAIKNVKLYKGEFPARYGGRLSSVVDIKLKDGDMNKQHLEFFVGFLSSKISLNGPIIKDKISYLFSLQRCNLDLATRTLDLITKNPNKGGYTFYDVNFKLTYKLSKNDNLHLFVYNGRDKHFVVIEDTEKDANYIKYQNVYFGKINNKWGNNAAGLKWTHKFNKLYSTFNLGFTNFYYQTVRYSEVTDRDSAYLKEKSTSNFSNSVTSIFAKQNFDYYLTNTLSLNFGAFFYKHIFNPGNLFYDFEEIGIGKITINSNQEILKPIETGAYFELNKVFFNTIEISAGVHNSYFITNDTFFNSYQPRLKANIKITDDINIKLAYTNSVQPLHLLTLSTALVPADIWVPATKKAPPSRVDLFSTGATIKLYDNDFLIGFDVFYKKLSHLIDLIPFAEVDDDLTDEKWESQIATNGIGDIYGFELLFSKNTGKITGWLSYTYMKNDRQYDKINNGQKFQYYYDRRHFLTIFANFEITKKISISSNFILTSGLPLTAATQKQNIENFTYISSYHNQIDYDVFYKFNFDNKQINYTQINNYHLPIYHRLDISIDFIKETKKYTRLWSIGVYNAYNRQNPYFIFFKKDRDNILRLYQFTLFPIIPSISYSIKF